MKTKIINKLPDFIFFFSILFFTVGLNFQDNPPSGWYQQFLPEINNRPISDITFLDSLTGFSVTPYTANDTAYILKTTNGGDNWSIIFKGPTNIIGGFNAVQFLNLNTGYVCGNFLRKTTNGGLNWFQVNTSGIFPENMYVLNKDTIWLIDSESLTGGVFRTTNGGLNWTQQLSLGSMNPTNIYFYNRNIGFITKNNDYLRKTTNSGISWSLISGIDGFRDIYFIDSLTGWKCSEAGGFMKKTTDGGQSWVTQTLASGGIIQTSGLFHFSNVNRDTIWGAGGYVLYPNNQIRAILHRTTNGGNNWFYQIADTSIHIYLLYFINFIDKYTGWAYDYLPTGIHTKSGGDTTFLNIQQISSEIPVDFKLHQNYPNPFNPVTEIIFEVKKTADIKLIVFDINGREIATLINKRLLPGSYKYRFNGSKISSGIYFYSLLAEGKIVDTKKMLMIK